MAPPSSPGVVGRLTAKAGPLPVWAWAALILGAVFIYSRRHPGAKTDTTATPPDSSSSSGADSVSSGQGGAGDNMSQPMFDSLAANTSSLDALTSQLLSLPVGSGFGGVDPLPGDPGPAGPAGPAGAPGPAATPTPAAAKPAAAAHPSQTAAAGKLSWGGRTFTTQRAFDAWAKAHGSSSKGELRNHPQARAIYSTLK